MLDLWHIIFLLIECAHDLFPWLKLAYGLLACPWHLFFLLFLHFPNFFFFVLLKGSSFVLWVFLFSFLSFFRYLFTLLTHTRGVKGLRLEGRKEGGYSGN